MSSRKDIGLYRRQLEILRTPGREILAVGPGGGKSHALRAALVICASARPNRSCVLAHPNNEELYAEHIEGPTGLKAMLSEAAREGAVEFRPGTNEARFKNGSRLSWLAFDKVPEVRRFQAIDRVDLGCIDEAHRIALDQYETLVRKSSHAVSPGRLLVAAPLVTGWIQDRWSNGHAGRAIVETSREDLPESLRVVAQLPTIEQFMDSLGVPFLAPDSSFRQAQHVQKIINVLQRWFFGEFQRLMILMPTQHGKAVSLDTPIRTPSGWTTMRDLAVGDEVFAPDGSATRVTFKSPVMIEDEYEVTSDDGFRVFCHGKHEWVVNFDRRRGFKTKTTEYLDQRPHAARRPRLSIHEPLRMNPVQLPVDPWVLGVWLGDGTSQSGQFTVSEEDFEWVIGRIRHHFPAKRLQRSPEVTPTIGTRGLQTRLRSLGVLGNKHVPSSYQNAPTAARLELLQGLIDSDGYVAKDGTVEFCSTRRRLAENVRELVVGLGIKAFWSESPSRLGSRDCGTRYRVTFHSGKAASMPRKRERLRLLVKKRDRYLSVRRTGRRSAMQCIAVDHPSHQYLAGEGMLATHNTILGVRVMAGYIEFCRPYETVGIASYSDGVAQKRNRDARDFYVKAGGRLLEGSTAVDYWRTQYGGGVWAAGFVGAQAGNPMTWGLVDDPDRNTKESKSPTMMDDKDDWYLETWLGREAKYADRRMSQLWCATRFHRRDTVGRVLDIHVKRKEPWHILALPALYDPEVATYYKRLGDDLFTVEPDFRTEPGEPIDPNNYDREYWETNCRSSLRKFLGRDQQKPEDSDGGQTFNEKWPIDLSVDPAFQAGRSLRSVYFVPTRSWDLAATVGAGDWTACVSLGETRDSNRIVIRHAARARLGSRDVMRMIAGTMLLDGPDVDIVLPEDPAAAGKHQTGRIVDYLRQVAKRVSIDCHDCDGPGCQRCAGFGRVRFRIPLIRTASTREGLQERFEDFADRATPISNDVEGSVDFVDADWTPTIESTVPWFSQAIERETDRDWQEELRQIRRLMRRFTSGEDPDLVWCGWQDPYFHELHLFPDGDHDDWVAATVHGWGLLKKPRSVYPKG